LSIRIGVIGPKDSIELIRSVEKEINGDFTIVEKIYKSYEELENIKSFYKNVDTLLFSGQIPYFWIKAKENPDIPMVYIPRNGTCLYRMLFDLYRDKVDISALSFDTIKKSHIDETYRELSLPLREVYTIDYDCYLSYDEIISYHIKLWKSQKTKAAVTCLQKTYEELNKLGIPAYRIYPTRSIVRQYLEKALLYGESVKLKETQIALIIVRAEDVNDMLNERSSYQVKRLMLELEQVLLDYSEQNQASIVKVADTEFMLITTRGNIEEYPSYYTGSQLLKRIKVNSPLKVAVGIGYGRTARMAETNARAALSLSAREGGNCYFLVIEEGNILGPLRPELSSYSEDFSLDLDKLAKKLNMNILNLRRIKSALRHINKTEITSKELGIAMNLSERSARRILSQMEKKGAAEIVGDRALSDKGRPRLVYKILI
jgi:hypothetical protein